MIKFNQIKGSSTLSPAHGRVGARATILSFSVSVPPPEKITGGFQQAGKKEGGLGGRNFCPPAPSSGAETLGRDFCPSGQKLLLEKGSSLVQQLRPIKTFQIFKGKSLLARPAGVYPARRCGSGSRFAKSPVFRN